MKKSGMLLAGSMLLAIFLSGCSRSDAQETTTFTACREPRPEICYEIYAPVCASLNTGMPVQVTFSNDCTACTDPQVRGFVQGKCK
jgi:hypothetical protein